MNLALVIDRFDPSKGGAESYLAALGSWLATRGHRVAILSQDAPRPGADFPFELRRIGRAGAPRPWRDVLFRREAARALGGFDASLGVRGTVGTSVYAPHGGVYRVAERANLRSVRSSALRAAKTAARRVSLKHAVLRATDDAAIRSEATRVLVAVSERVERDLREALRGREKRVEVVRNGVDLARFRPENRLAFRAPWRRRLGLDDRVPVWLFVAHNFRLKGIDTAIAALARPSSAGRDATLLVAGRGHRARAARVAARLGLGGRRVLFAGDVREIDALYAAADVLVHPTHYDPSSLVALEAMASGLPIVTTREDGTSEIVRPGVEGEVLANPGDAAELAAAVERALDPARGRRYVAAARARAEEWPWERNFAAMEALLAGARA